MNRLLPMLLIVFLAAASLAAPPARGGTGSLSASAGPGENTGRRAARATPPPAASQPEKIVVAVAPFIATGLPDEDGHWSKAVTDSFYMKLVRWPLTDPIDRFSYADVADAEHMTVRWDTPVPDLVRFMDKALLAKVLIYGDVAVADAKAGVLTIRVRAIDLRAGPVLAVDRKFEISYPTQVRPAAEIVLNQLVGYSTINMEVPALVKLTPAMEQRWKDGPNLVPNPDFDQAHGPPSVGVLARWEVVIGDKRYNPPKFDGTTAPVGDDPRRMGLWGVDPADPKARALHMAINEDVAGSYGVACYSDWIAITPGCIYRFAVRWRTDGPTPKVFIKGYALRPTPGEKLIPTDSADYSDSPLIKSGKSAKSAGNSWQRREVYRRQVHPSEEADPKRDLGNGLPSWTETTADFCPRHDTTPPHWLRIDLYAYWPKGHAWFSHVVLKQLSDKPVVEQRDPPDLPTDPTTAAD